MSPSRDLAIARVFLGCNWQRVDIFWRQCQHNSTKSGNTIDSIVNFKRFAVFEEFSSFSCSGPTPCTKMLVISLSINRFPKIRMLRWPEITYYTFPSGVNENVHLSCHLWFIPTRIHRGDHIRHYFRRRVEDTKSDVYKGLIVGRVIFGNVLRGVW